MHGGKRNAGREKKGAEEWAREGMGLGEEMEMVVDEMKEQKRKKIYDEKRESGTEEGRRN